MKRQLCSIPGTLFLLSATLVMPFSLSADDAPQPPRVRQRSVTTTYSQSQFRLSKQRVIIIREILDEAIAKGDDITKPYIISLLETKIGNKMPLEPKAPISNKPVSYFREQARNLDRQVIAAEEEKVRRAATAEAAKRYPLTAPKTKVKFQYRKGPYLRTIEGIFYQANNRYIQVNANRIPLVDLPEELQTRFLPSLNEAKRQEFIQEKIFEYRRNHAKRMQAKFTELLAAQDLENEKNGYIYDSENRCWLTAKQVYTTMLAEAQERYKKHMAEEAKRRAEEEAKLREQREKELAAGGGVPTIDTSSDERYEEIISGAKTKIQALHKTASGVDAQQGYGLAIWGSDREEVAYIFSRTDGLKYIPTKSYNKLITTHHRPYEVFFYFQNNKLCRTIEFYGKEETLKTGATEADVVKIRVLGYDEFDDLLIRLHDAYGAADEEKKDERRDLFKEITDGKLKPAQLHPPKEGEEESVLFTFTWTGKTSIMTLSFEYNYDEDIFIDVCIEKHLISAKPAADEEGAKK